MSKDLSTNGKNSQDPDKDLPGPLEALYDTQCDNPACGRGFGFQDENHYQIVGPTGLILRVYCSALCLATVMDPDLVKVLAQEVAEKMAKDAQKLNSSQS